MTATELRCRSQSETANELLRGMFDVAPAVRPEATATCRPSLAAPAVACFAPDETLAWENSMLIKNPSSG